MNSMKYKEEKMFKLIRSSFPFLHCNWVPKPYLATYMQTCCVQVIVKWNFLFPRHSAVQYFSESLPCNRTLCLSEFAVVNYSELKKYKPKSMGDQPLINCIISTHLQLLIICPITGKGNTVNFLFKLFIVSQLIFTFHQCLSPSYKTSPFCCFFG